MSDIRLRSARLRVVMGDPDDPSTWAEFDVQTIGADASRAEHLFVRHGWGKMLDQPIRFQQVTAWAALTRRESIALTLDEFDASCIEVTKGGDEDDDDDADVVRPTQPGPAPG